MTKIISRKKQQEAHQKELPPSRSEVEANEKIAKDLEVEKKREKRKLKRQRKKEKLQKAEEEQEQK